MNLTAADELVEHLVEFYDRAAPGYDDWADGLNGKVALRLVDLADPQVGEACLDVGCGTGTLTHLIAERVGRRGSVVGIDLSARMLDIARAKRSAKNTTFMAMAAEQMFFREKSFDLITYGQSLPYLLDPAASLDEAVRLLKPGGRLALSLHRRSLHTEAQEVFYEALSSLAQRHYLTIPQHSSDRSLLGERETIEDLFADQGFVKVAMTEMVTGGRAKSPREWIDLMAGTGPLPGTLIGVLGPRLREEFGEQLQQAMAPLGEEAFRYHFSFIFARGELPKLS